VYCKTSSVLAAPSPPVAPAPSVIVIQAPTPDYGEHYEHAHHAAVAQAHRTARMGWLVYVIVFVVLSLGGAGAGFAQCTRHSSILSGLVWDGSEPLHCTGIENIAVSGVEATFTAGAAIVATGNCQVKCTDCKLRAPTIVEASGNAQVSLVNGSAEGSLLLADASGNARVTAGGNIRVSGRTRESGNAKVSAPTPPPAPPPATTPTPGATAIPTVTAPAAAAAKVASPAAKPQTVKPKQSAK